LAFALARLAFARLRLTLAHLIADLALALPDATLLVLAELEVGDVDPRQGNGDELLPLATDEVARRDEAAKLLLDFAADDFAESV